MKKNKEWLKEEIKKLITEESQYMPHDEMVDLGLVLLTIDQLEEQEVKQLDKKIKELDSYNDELIRDNNQLRNTLDNQEVLSQEWIDEHKYNHYIGKPFVYVEDLQNLLVPKQDKPVIPKFIVNWIEETKKQGKSLVFAITHIYYKNEIGKSPNKEEEKIFQWMELAYNEEVFARAWIDGYKVEKEPVYFAKIKGHELVETKTILDDDTGDDVSEFYRNIYFVLQRDGELIVDMKDNGLSGAKNVMTMSQWSDLGINETNADFEEVKE